MIFKNDPPAKRQRPQTLPDGFAPSASSSRHLARAPKIQSDFGKKNTTSSTRPLRPLSRPDFGGLDIKPATKTNGFKSLLDSRPRPPFSGISKPSGASVSSPMKMSGLRPIFPQQKAITAAAKTTTERESKTSTMLHNPPIINTRKTDASLKPVPGPPPLPRLDKANPMLAGPSKLKTISTTRVAIATDPSTESGSFEIFSLFLQQQIPGCVDSVDRELRRGLIQSPEKGSSGTGKGKYVRCAMITILLSCMLMI